MNEMTLFDKSTKWYDWLSKLVFGNRLRKIERKLIPHLPHTGTILWVGGGSGQVLPEIIDARPDLKILYLDSSENMINLARKRISGAEANVSFFTSQKQLTDCQEDLAAVLLFFVLDVFEEGELQEALSKWILNNGKKASLLLVADFDYPTTWPGNVIAKLLIPLMYFFFSLTIQIPTTKLPNWKKSLMQLSYAETSVNTSLIGIIRSGCWRLS